MSFEDEFELRGCRTVRAVQAPEGAAVGHVLKRSFAWARWRECGQLVTMDV